MLHQNHAHEVAGAVQQGGAAVAWVDAGAEQKKGGVGGLDGAFGQAGGLGGTGCKEVGGGSNGGWGGGQLNWGAGGYVVGRDF